MGHLNELRGRLIKCVIAVVITTALSFIFADRIFHVLITPAGDINLIFTDLTEMIGAYMKVSLAGGLTLAMPFLVYQLVMFVSPALTPREKRYVYIILPWITFMFLGGVAFGYFVLIPPAMKFLLTFGSDIATPAIKIGNYVSIITRLLVAVGVVFETPVVITFLARLGIVKAKWLASKRKYAIVAAFVIAAAITPTFDPVNQSLVAVPIVVLYELSIWLARLVQPRAARVATPVPSP